MELTQKIINDLAQLADPKKAKLLQRFFKTGPGEYGEGDVFIGIVMPNIRIVVSKYFRVADFETIKDLLHDPVHERRMCALLLLAYQFPKADETKQKQIFDFYLANTAKYINNWDLVDVSCKHIVGAYLYKRNRTVLYDLARSGNLWEKRVAIISSSYFIGRNDFSDTLALSEILVNEKHDLMHKAVGWMLREVYKRNPLLTIAFLDKHKDTMPRTTLRYAIEKMSPTKRMAYLKKTALQNPLI